MKNVQMKIDGSVLTITVDLSVAGTPSKSGKSKVLASTEGNVALAAFPEIKMGLNIYK